MADKLSTIELTPQLKFGILGGNKSLPEASLLPRAIEVPPWDNSQSIPQKEPDLGLGSASVNTQQVPGPTELHLHHFRVSAVCRASVPSIPEPPRL